MTRQSMLQQYDEVLRDRIAKRRNMERRYERIFKADDDDDRGDEQHFIGQIADLMVESGNGEVSRQEAMHWLLNTPQGRALIVHVRPHRKAIDAACRKHASNREVHTMRIVKSRDDFISLCKRILAGKVTDITANELTALYPGDGFAKLVNDKGADGLTVRKALSALNPFSLDRPVATAKQASAPKFVAADEVGSDDDDEDDDESAQDELDRLAEERRRQTGESKEKAFAKVYEQNKALAQRERRQAMKRLYVG